MLPSPDSSQPPPSPMRKILNFLVFFISFTLTAERVNRWAEDLQADNANLAFYLKRQDDFNVVFAGSSVVHDMIVPAEFDRVMKEAGYDVRSFNVGRAGGFAHETNYVLRRLLGPFRPRPAVLFIDFMAFEPQLNEPESARVRNWHDLSETASALITVWQSSSHTGREKRDMARQHLRLALQRFFPLGRFYEEGRATPEDLQLIEEYRGYMPFEILRESDSIIASMNAYFLNEPEDYEDLLQKRLDEVEGVSGEPMRSLNRFATARQTALLRRRNLTSVYVAGPSLRYDLRETRSLVADPGVTRVLLYDDPRSHPELFERDARYDRHHLNDSSAIFYTAKIAQDLLELADNDPAVARQLNLLRSK